MQPLPQTLRHALQIKPSAVIERLGGNENENYLVNSAHRPLMVKRLQSRNTQADTEIEGQYRHYMAAAGLLVSEYLPLDGTAYTFSCEDGLYVVTPFVAGHQAPRNSSTVRQTARFLAQLHCLPTAKLPPRQTWLTPDYPARSWHLIANMPTDQLNNLRQRLTDAPDFWQASLPSGLVHGDLHTNNVIVSEQGTIVSVIDWEECTIASRQYYWTWQSVYDH
jgi:Ser/Thr protein kinase RdoA (MazF antagonist)